ncbi:MAG: hypothetical protein P4L64_16635 [Caulobacteraceae bacterium]|nr:hypothetical protein [Caulobacteraceae bacterium]
MTDITLPAGFEALTPFLDWNLPTANGRQTKRRTSSREALKAFYDAALPLLPAILAKADEYPLGALPAEIQPLYNIALAVAEVAPHIELYRGDPGVPYAFEEARFVAVHGDQETWRGQPPMAHP